jgi:hypothetical protein
MTDFHIQVDAISAMQGSMKHQSVDAFPALVVPNICLLREAVNDSNGALKGRLMNTG